MTTFPAAGWRLLLLRRHVRRLCTQIARSQDAVNLVLNDTSPGAHTFRIEMYGRIEGLRIALCLVMGWDPVEDSDDEGRADNYVRARHPETYGDRRGATAEEVDEIAARAWRHIHEGPTPLPVEDLYEALKDPTRGDADLAWFRVTAGTSMGSPVEAIVVARTSADAMVTVGDRLRAQYGVDHLGEGNQDWRAVRMPGAPGRREGIISWYQAGVDALGEWSSSSGSESGQS